MADQSNFVEGQTVTLTGVVDFDPRRQVLFLLPAPGQPPIAALQPANDAIRSQLFDAQFGNRAVTVTGTVTSLISSSVDFPNITFPEVLVATPPMVFARPTPTPTPTPRPRTFRDCWNDCRDRLKIAQDVAEGALASCGALGFAFQLASVPVPATVIACLATAAGVEVGDLILCLSGCGLSILLSEAPEGIPEGPMIAMAPEGAPGEEMFAIRAVGGPGGAPEGAGGSSSWGSESSRSALVGQVAAAPPQVAAMGATHVLATSAGMVPLRTINQVARQRLDACAMLGQGARVVGSAQGGVLLVDFAWCLPPGRV